MVQQTLSYRRLYRHSEACWTGAGCGSLWRKGDGCSWRQSCGGESDRKVERSEQRCRAKLKVAALPGTTVWLVELAELFGVAITLKSSMTWGNVVEVLLVKFESPE